MKLDWRGGPCLFDTELLNICSGTLLYYPTMPVIIESKLYTSKCMLFIYKFLCTVILTF